MNQVGGLSELSAPGHSDPQSPIGTLESSCIEAMALGWSVVPDRRTLAVSRKLGCHRLRTEYALGSLCVESRNATKYSKCTAWRILQEEGVVLR